MSEREGRPSHFFDNHAVIMGRKEAGRLLISEGEEIFGERKKPLGKMEGAPDEL